MVRSSSSTGGRRSHLVGAARQPEDADYLKRRGAANRKRSDAAVRVDNVSHHEPLTSKYETVKTRGLRRIELERGLCSTCRRL